MTYHLSFPSKSFQGHIVLDGSKSISNRALIVQAFARDVSLERLSTSKDTTTLQRLLLQTESHYDAGAAGTTYRFMTAWLAMQAGSQVLTGSERMLERPIGVLVEALRNLGASIAYLGEEGYPPLAIHAPSDSFGIQHKVSLSSDTSSQYITALLLIAPYLPKGLELELKGHTVSMSYIDMTIALMGKFGVKVKKEGVVLKVAPQTYTPSVLVVEGDWSAASYYYALAAIAEEVDLFLEGLFVDSWQGDAVLPKLLEKWGVETIFEAKGIRLRKSKDALVPSFFEYDFTLCPDIAQTMAVVCGATGTQGLFSGLETLSIKETDRIKALQEELQKVQVYFSKLPPKFSGKSGKTFYMVEGKATWGETVSFDTYDDHRMAMSFAPLAVLHPIAIVDPQVVVKSYVQFWEDWEKMGCSIVKA